MFKPTHSKKFILIKENGLFETTRSVARAVMGRWLRTYGSLEISGADIFNRIPQCILAPVHASHLDFWAVLESLPQALRHKTYVAAARDYFYASWARLGITRLFSYHNFPFDRHARSTQEYRKLCQLLQSGLSLLIFPEGSRSRDGQLQAFKPLVSMLAVEQNIPLIPVMLRGTREALPAGRFWPRRAAIRVIFGAPVSVGTTSSETFHARVRRVQQELVDKTKKLWHLNS
jgi:1-acyl-sn-glycerol-3-phosphate acyltransferase